MSSILAHVRVYIVMLDGVIIITRIREICNDHDLVTPSEAKITMNFTGRDGTLSNVKPKNVVLYVADYDQFHVT